MKRSSKSNRSSCNMNDLLRAKLFCGTYYMRILTKFSKE